MTASSRRLLIAVLIALAALGGGALLYGPLRQAVIAPLVNIAWQLVVLINKFPQAIFWAIFVGAALLIAWRSLPRFRLPDANPDQAEAGTGGPVASLARLVHESAYGRYFRWRLIRRLLELTFAANGYHERLNAREAGQLLYSQTLHLPSDLAAYLSEGLEWTMRGRSLSRLERLWLSLRRRLAPHKAPAPDPALERLITHLEEETGLASRSVKEHT
jgi:membrane protein implicated in regulation of membrane protease activity